ncbi:hypothetical protein TNIN_408771 [Trichonephila inaurata madagascariensis]|uniref:Uncharacterized protein n=1 Tax=Trichonephila inaurata madagascariensis TaxID=2747483 RepID=A0A8X6XV68_9ARAC|nr:hypothetical protein TNIN_408771 [Trichonephila inaurata madagascariensis]
MSFCLILIGLQGHDGIDTSESESAYSSVICSMAQSESEFGFDHVSKLGLKGLACENEDLEQEDHFPCK